MPVGFIPPVRFGSTQGNPGVNNVPDEKSIVGKTDDAIVTLLNEEAPHTSYIGRGWAESLSTRQLAQAYTPYIGDAQGIYLMFQDLYKSDPHKAPRAVMEAFTRRYLVTDNDNEKGYKRGLGYVNIGMHPIIAQVVQHYHSDLGSAGYRYKDSDEAKKAFPVLFQVMNLPDKARAAKLLKETFKAYQGIDFMIPVVDKFISDVLPNRKAS